MSEQILVIGGTGKTGRKIVTRLQELNKNVRVGSRNATPAFDWDDPDTWADALDGIQKMYVTYQPDLAVPGALEAIEKLTRIAKTKGVQQIVLLSGKGEREAELCEQVVINSGIAYTIVRASWFNQNFSESFFLDPIVAGHVALPQADATIPFVDTDDIADVAVEALLHEKHHEQIYQLTGTRLLTFKDVVAEIAQATGRDIAFMPITMGAYTTMLEEHQVPKDYIWLINYLFTEVLGDPSISEMTNDIEKVLGRKAKDFTEYAQEVAQTGIWDARTEASV